MARTSLQLAACVIALAIAPLTAFSHASKDGTQPADGAVLATPPSSIQMTFDMPMRVTQISLTDQDGAEHTLDRNDEMQPVTSFNARVPALPKGVYTVDWRGLSEDGHPMQGSFSFEVTE